MGGSWPPSLCLQIGYFLLGPFEQRSLSLNALICEMDTVVVTSQVRCEGPAVGGQRVASAQPAPGSRRPEEEVTTGIMTSFNIFL